jgi:hypothetical protein
MRLDHTAPVALARRIWNHATMEERSKAAHRVAWLGANLTIVAVGCAAWGWLDYRYVTENWTPAEMMSAAEWIPFGLTVAAMIFNFWALRARRPAVQAAGSVAASVAVVAVWWGVIALAGGWFHAAIGGIPG